MQPVSPKAATTSITRLPNLVKGINNLAKGIDNLDHEVLSLMKGIDNLNHEVLNLMKGIDNLNHEVLNLVKGIDNLDHEVLNLVNEVAQLVKIAKNRVELAPDIASLTSTDRSVCATPALPVASLMLVKQDCVAQTLLSVLWQVAAPAPDNRLKERTRSSRLRLRPACRSMTASRRDAARSCAPEGGRGRILLLSRRRMAMSIAPCLPN